MLARTNNFRFLARQVPGKDPHDTAAAGPAGGLFQRNVGRLPDGLAVRARRRQGKERQRVPEQVSAGGGGPDGGRLAYKCHHEPAGELSALRQKSSSGYDRGPAAVAQSRSLERVDHSAEERE